jgi:hypothetical protein
MIPGSKFFWNIQPLKYFWTSIVRIFFLTPKCLTIGLFDKRFWTNNSGDESDDSIDENKRRKLS